MIDTAVIKIKAGNGGNGNVSLITEFYRPRGGPDGGNGGKGADVYLKSTSSINTLLPFKQQKEFEAQNGENGGRNYRSGKGGEDLIIPVPIGTVIYTQQGNDYKLVADLTTEGQTYLVARGGFGGYGNAHFKSSKNRTPRISTKGKTGEEKVLKLELKLLSNVGFIGFPSVGKSSLLNYLIKSNFKTAAYPFTTLSPNLGVLSLGEGRSLVLADLPGLIEGASEGKGLGDDFLRHAERCGVLVHILDISNTKTFLSGSLDYKLIAGDLLDNYKVINSELFAWNKNLVTKPMIVAINKIDLVDKAILEQIVKIVSKKITTPLFTISSFTGEGVDALVNYFKQNFSNIVDYSQKQIHKKDKKEDIYEINLTNIPNKRLVQREDLRQRPFYIKDDA